MDLWILFGFLFDASCKCKFCICHFCTASSNLYFLLRHFQFHCFSETVVFESWYVYFYWCKYYTLLPRYYFCELFDLQGEPKIGHYVWRLTSSAYIFKMPEPISIIFGTLQHRFILNAFIYTMFLKFIIQSGAIWRKLITRTWLNEC